MKASISQQQISQTAVKLGIPDVAFTQRRIARAFDLVATNKVNEVSHDDVESHGEAEASPVCSIYRVHSQYNDKIYTVEVNHGNPAVTLEAHGETEKVSPVRSIAKGKACAPHCTCPDGKKTVHCKHMIASMLVALEAKPDKLTIYDDTFDKRKSRHGKRNSKYGRWIVNDYKVRKGYVVYRDEHGKLNCACGKKNCRHCKAIRENLPKPEPEAPVSSTPRIENECGSVAAKWRHTVMRSHGSPKAEPVRRTKRFHLCAPLQDKLNGNNGTGDNSSPVGKLDANDPFQEAELLDIDQIEERSNGDLVHKLSNAEYVISYNGIMALAEQHGITFEASRHDETHTVIAHGRCENNTRVSGKPINGSASCSTREARREMTAMELAKRNAARQLLPLVEIKALEKKAQLEAEGVPTETVGIAPRAEFDWQKAKAKCLEIVPDFTFDILIHDLVKAGTLRQAHPSDYNRKEWLVIFDACKRDVETNGDAGNTASSGAVSSRSETFRDEQVSCAICSRTLTNPESVRLQVGPICREKIGIEGEAHLHGNIISDELIEASKLYLDETFQKRILRACLTLDAPAPVKVLNWLGKEYFGGDTRRSRKASPVCSIAIAQFSTMFVLAGN